MNKTIIRDSLYNAADCEIRNSEDIKYARGIIVGLVSGLMSTGLSFSNALKIVKSNLPDNYNPDTFPYSWREEE